MSERPTPEDAVVAIAYGESNSVELFALIAEAIQVERDEADRLVAAERAAVVAWLLEASDDLDGDERHSTAFWMEIASAAIAGGDHVK